MEEIFKIFTSFPLAERILKSILILDSLSKSAELKMLVKKKSEKINLTNHKFIL